MTRLWIGQDDVSSPASLPSRNRESDCSAFQIREKPASFSSRTADSVGSELVLERLAPFRQRSILFFSNNSIVYFFLSFFHFASTRRKTCIFYDTRSRSFLSFFSFGANWDFLSLICIRRDIKKYLYENEWFQSGNNRITTFIQNEID